MDLFYIADTISNSSKKKKGWEDAAYEFMCSTCMADVETVRQRSLCATGRSATVTGLYWISLAATVLY